MKKNLIIVGLLFCSLFFVGSISNARSLAETLGLTDIKRKAVLAKSLGLYPVFNYKKDGESTVTLSSTPPVTVQALIDAESLPAKAESTVPELETATVPVVKDSLVDIKIKHKEKVVKLIDPVTDKASGDYAMALWETIITSAKLYDDTISTAFDGNTKIEVTTNGFTYSTTFDQDPNLKFDTVKGTGKLVIKDQYWAGVTIKGPDGKVKTDVKLTISWKPGKIVIKQTLKGPRNLPFVASNTTTPDPKADQDGDIIVVVDCSIAITNGTTTYTWTRAASDATGKKKTKVKKKKIANPDPAWNSDISYFVLTQWDARLKKAILTKAP
jgi:hypothetical protein